MIRIGLVLLFIPCFLFAQESEVKCMLIDTTTPRASNFSLPKKKILKSYNEFKEFETSLTSSQWVRGYSYKINLNQLNQFIELPSFDDFLPVQNFSFLNTNLLNTYDTDIQLKGSLNLNGITNLMTLQGKLNKYDGNYFLQVSYHISTNNTSYIPKIVNERYQEGLALILKMNLERGN